jgi:hypothetical protein
MTDIDPEQATPLLAQILANHFPGATVEGDVVSLELAGLRVRCQAVPDVPNGPLRSVSLLFWFTGGIWQDREVFASASGYGPTVHEAVTSGARHWASTAAPVLRAALGGAPLDGEGVRTFDGALDSVPVRLLVEAIDRSFTRPGEVAPEDFVAGIREKLSDGAGFLAPRLLAADVLPILPGRPTLLSVFAGENPDQRILEVKIDGADWPMGAQAFSGPLTEVHAMALLREVAMIVPAGPTPLTRVSVERTLDGLAMAIGGRQRPAAAWRGWQAHSGLLDPPMTAMDLEELEDTIGPLPADYRAFLAEVGECGAGPGYGLVSPDHSAQVRLARGKFPFTERVDTPKEAVAGALVLGHAGCGVVWLLVVQGPCAGEVWVDAGGSSGGLYPVAQSFEVWYRAWLDNSVGSVGPFLQWDANACAPSAAIRQRLEQHEGPPETALAGASIALRAGGGAHFHNEDPIDPCEACLANLVRFGMEASDIGPGTEVLQAR